MAEETKKVEALAPKKAKAPKAKAVKAPKKAKKAAAPKKADKAVIPTGNYETRPAILKDFSVIKHVIVTESTQKLEQSDNAMVFAVDVKATKPQIKAAVQAIFSAKVKSVNTSNVSGKTKRVGRFTGTLSAYKKAVVRFDSSFDIGKITAAVASEERKANAPKEDKPVAEEKTAVVADAKK
jgi:large subunit ribosomal protein L23